ncbi:pentatricopeptide repeat-containing protein [Tanacetum coccineum]
MVFDSELYIGVLKDGIGYLSKIFLSKYGRHFDVNPKGWRLFADFLENAAFGMEIVTPAFPHLFVPIGAAAGAGDDCLVFGEYLLSRLVPSVKEVNDEEPFFPALPLSLKPANKAENRVLSPEAKEAAATIEQRLELGSKLSDIVKTKTDAHALLDFYLYWLEKNVGLNSTGISDDCGPVGMLQISLEYVEREFNHAKRDGELAGWEQRDMTPGPPAWVLIMYDSCGSLDNARKVFDEMSKKDFNSWAIMIAGYADNGEYEEVIRLFVNDKFRRVGCFEDGEMVFDHIGSRRNVVVWTARIINNCKEERFCEVFEVFNEMGKEGVRKNSFTLSSVLSACSKICDDGNCGEQVHANAIKLGLASKSYMQCGLVNMYGKFGLMNDAKRVFYMKEGRRNRACWNAMLTSLVQNGCLVEATKFLYQIVAE